MTITNDTELDEAIREIDSLLDRMSLTKAEQARLDELSDAIEEYERDQEPKA